MSELTETILVDIDDLGVDTCNIRGGEWERDDEFIEDIKNNGVLNPLLVRPAKPETGIKYAIVCGSRRYNAALEAGLDRVPCFVREINDIDALGRTIAENKHSKDTPSWRYALKIGEMAEKLNHNARREDIIKTIGMKTGFSERSVKDYLSIAQWLPGEIIELMKAPEKRSKEATELLKRLGLAQPQKTLGLHKAAIIARELRGYPIEKLIDVAVAATTVPVDIMHEFVDAVKTFPKMSASEVYLNKVLMIPKGWRASIIFDSALSRAIYDACNRRQMQKTEFVLFCVRSKLEEEGYL